MTAQELERQLLALSPDEQLETVQVLMRAVSGPVRGIVKLPEVAGGSACISGTRIPVWLLESYRRQGMSDGQILEGYPGLSAADLVSAWAYVKVCQQEVDADLRAKSLVTDAVDTGLREGVERHLLDRMVKIIVEVAQPEKVVLFGSRAKGTAVADSDYDFLVIMAEEFGNGRSRRKEIARVTRALAKFGVTADVLMYGQREAAERCHRHNDVVFEAMTQGRVIYG